MNTRHHVGESSSAKEYMPNGIDLAPSPRKLGFRDAVIGKSVLNYFPIWVPVVAARRRQQSSLLQRVAQEGERYFPTLHRTIAHYGDPETIPQREEQSDHKAFAPLRKHPDCCEHENISPRTPAK